MTEVDDNKVMDSVPSITRHNRQAFCTWINHCICEKICFLFVFVFFLNSLLAVKFRATGRWAVTLTNSLWLAESESGGIEKTTAIAWQTLVCLVCSERHPTETFHLSVCFQYGRVYKKTQVKKKKKKTKSSSSSSITSLGFDAFCTFFFSFSCVTENQPPAS